MNSRNRIHSCYSNQDQGLLMSLLVATSDATYSKPNERSKEKCRSEKLLAQRCTRKAVEKIPSLLCHWDVAVR